MTRKTNIIKHDGKLDLSGFTIDCYVLEDGTRVLSAREMQRALKMVDEESNYQVAGTRLQRYLDQKSLRPFIYNEKSENYYDPIVCYQGDKKINGYEATVLVDICDAFMEAKNNIELSSRQTIIATQCEILIRSFAKVGIIALIDEATGFKKAQDEYQRLVGMYIADELRPWLPTFEEDYYQQLYRLIGWDWSLYTSGVWKNHPQYVGKITNEIVYNKLPRGVLDELNKLNPKNEKGNRKHKHHQFLSENVGYRELLQHFGKLSVIFSMYGEGEYKLAKAHIDSLLPDFRVGKQLGLDIPMDANDYSSISSFNRKKNQS
ncbi:P63C domain-containing protein [Psychrobacter sp. B38]|uniref:P63C domain-containing protein n=1 Tax=Psychrobacter sp. B38 TaxID=3143538 RepID=UPI00321018E8